jgi:hypothetical protein
MSEDAAKIDLAALQRRLDALRVGEHLTIAASDYRRLFGIDDVAQRRVAHFARGHGCRLDAAPSVIRFHKTRAPSR